MTLKAIKGLWQFPSFQKPGGVIVRGNFLRVIPQPLMLGTRAAGGGQRAGAGPVGSGLEIRPNSVKFEIRWNKPPG